MHRSSATHLVLIPSYNPGPKVFDTVRAALDQWSPVWIVVDGSTDGSTLQLLEMAATHPGMRVLICPENRGKGAAVLHGIREAMHLGFTHALTMDSDGHTQCLGTPCLSDSACLRLALLGRAPS